MSGWITKIYHNRKDDTDSTLLRYWKEDSLCSGPDSDLSRARAARFVPRSLRNQTPSEFLVHDQVKQAIRAILHMVGK
jgi:hypothetical protein